jgi:RsiW-degrading membrane proteinase PrsW (M82 family)
MTASAIAALGIAMVGALIPTFLFAGLLWWFDRYEKEPLTLMGAATLWGSLAQMAVTLLRPLVLAGGAALFDPLWAGTWGNAFLLPALEEVIKALFLAGFFILYAREIDSLYDGFLYGALTGFAFAAADTIVGAPARGWSLEGAFGRTLALGLAHAFFTGWIGLGLAAGRLSRSPARPAWPLLGVLTAFLSHSLRELAIVPTLWNPGLAGIRALINALGVLLLIGIVIYGMGRERAWIARYLAEEVSAGVLPAALYEVLRSPGGWLTYRWGPLLRGDATTWRRRGQQLQVAAELAFRKHQQAALGEARWEEEIRRLRELLRRLAE